MRTFVYIQRPGFSVKRKTGPFIFRDKGTKTDRLVRSY